MSSSGSSFALRWAWSRLAPYRSALVALAALSTAEIVLRVVAPFAMVVVVDHALGSAPLSRGIARALGGLGLPIARGALLGEFVVIGALLQLAHELVVMVHGRVSVRVGQSMIRDLRDELFEHVQAWTLRHHGATPAGDVVQTLSADTRCVDQIVMRGMFPVVFSLLTLVVMFGVLVAIAPHLALLSLAVVPPMYLWLRYYALRMAPRADHARRTDSRLSSRLVEAVATIRLVKSHAREDAEHARFRDVAHASAQAWIGVGQQGTVFSIGIAALTIAGTTLVLFVGGLAVQRGALSIGTLLLALAYLGYVYGPLSAIASTANGLHDAFASARRVRAAFAIAREPADPPGAISADAIRGDVRLDDVTFAYAPELVPALDHVSITARPGEMIALVGPSGAGKSTLASLLVRFYDPSAGTITIDGTPIDRFTLRSLRRRVAIVLQDSILVSGTIRGNLRYARPDASDADVERAARAANAHAFIAELPDGYDTEIGEGGLRLSGGQRQRLSIARAFLKDAPILILDEPTAALDTLSERLVIEAVQRLWAGRTTFVIAHRLSTVRDAHRIAVMDRGRIVATGTHDELLANCVLYQQLAQQLTAPGTRAPAGVYAGSP